MLASVFLAAETAYLVAQVNINKYFAGLGSVDFNRVARRLRSSPYPMTSMDKAFSLVLVNSAPLPIIAKNYKGMESINLLYGLNKTFKKSVLFAKYNTSQRIFLIARIMKKK